MHAQADRESEKMVDDGSGDIEVREGHATRPSVRKLHMFWTLGSKMPIGHDSVPSDLAH